MQVSIFLASPGDVSKEKGYVHEVVEELNRTLAHARGITLIIKEWKADTFPGHGKDAQAIVNEQIAEMTKYALFVGIMWNRLGTPTPRADSGTVEEFDRAEAAKKEMGHPAIWFYFREANANLRTEEQLDQKKKVLAFRKRVEANGLHRTYTTPANLRDQFRQHLTLWLNSRQQTQVREIPPHIGISTQTQNLPYTTLGTLFKGRDEFVQKLRDTLLTKPEKAAAVVATKAIHGLGGVGKTRLAVEYAWKFRDQYTALLFVTADSPSNLRRNLASLCGPLVLNLPEREAKEEEVQVAAALRWLETHPSWFLILDNVDTADAADEVEQLVTQLAGSKGHVVVTSRLADWSNSVESLELDVLEEKDAAAFLMERTSGKRKTTKTDETDARALAGDLDGLALGLEQAGAFIAKHRLSFTEYRSRWAAEEAKVREWFDERLMHYPKSVAVTWQTSFDQLGEDGRKLLNVLAWLAPDPMSVDMILQKHEGEKVSFDTEAGLADLATYSLAKWSADRESVTIHRLVQDVTRTRLPDDARKPWIESTLMIVNGYAPSESYDARTWPVWDMLRVHIPFLQQFANDFGIVEPTRRLVNGLGLYFHAKGLEQYMKDNAEAAKNFRKAAEAGQADSQNYLGWLYHNGWGVTQDYVEAMEWYRKAAEKGHAIAHYNVGSAYHNGWGVPQDYVEAMKWYEVAAAKGYANAIYNIGWLYHYGKGVALDYAEAMRWYLKAAEQNSPHAQNNIGALYTQGLGVPKDDSKAIEWFRKAVNQGFETAKAWLKRLNAE